MIEQEMASIVRFILDAADNPSPYYWNVPESFLVPAVYFETPEILTGGETFLTYHADYTWYIRFFDRTQQGAWQSAYKVLHAIKRARNLIPLIDIEGNEIEGEGIRINDPSMHSMEDDSAQITIRWRSRQPYGSTLEAAKEPTADHFSWDLYFKNGYIPGQDEIDTLLAQADKLEK